MKVWVVGAGPAGLSTAISLMTNDVSSDVSVFDREVPSLFRAQRCAGGVSTWLLEKVDLFPLPKSVVAADIHCFRVYSPNMRDYWELRTKSTLGYVIDRNRFQRYLAERAERLGVTVCWKYEMTKDVLSKSKADVIVGADGPISTVASWVGASRPSLSEVHHCVQKTIKWPDYPQDTIEVYFSNKIAPKGYAWCFPAGKEQVRIGLGIPLSSKSTAANLLGDFLAEFSLVNLDRGFLNIKHLEFISKLVPTAKPRKSNVFMNGRVMLVGDAGLHTDPLLGGGIVQGIIAGQACGRAIAEGKPFLFDEYANWLVEHNRWRYKLKKVLTSFSDKDLTKFVEMLQKLDPPKEPVSVAKELKKVVKQLIWKKPSIILKLLFS